LSRWRRRSPSWSIATRYRLFGRLERVPTQIITREQESADNAMGGVSTVGLATTTWSRAQLRFSSCASASDCACGLWQSNGFSPRAPPGNSGRSSAIPARPSATVADGLGGAPRVFLRHSNRRSARPRAACGRWCSSTPQTHRPDQPAAPRTAFQTHWASQVGEQYGPSIAPFARARCPFSPLLRPYSPGGAARGSHTRANFCVSDLAVVS
jgi:hypothetical protein